MSEQTTTTAMRRVITRDLPNGDYLVITALLRDGSDGLSAGFSVTLDGWERRGKRSGAARARDGQDIDFGGADHGRILSAAPELAPVVTVHLADPDGTPMHALANGWHFYSGSSRGYELKHYGQAYVDRMGTDHDRAARALHIPPADLPTGLDREAFEGFCRDLAPRWADQASAARAVLAASD